MANKRITMTVYMGCGKEGLARVAALKHWASLRGASWNGKPSVGRLLCEIADEDIAESKEWHPDQGGPQEDNQ